jgi:hypothetical protein
MFFLLLSISIRLVRDRFTPRDPVEPDGGEEHPEGQPALAFVVHTLAAVASDEGVPGDVSP